MILLDPSNKILEETLKESFNSGVPERISMVISDFDGASYKLETTESKTTIVLSMAWKCYSELVTYGANDIIQREYGNYIATPETGFDVSLKFDLSKLPSDKDILIKKAALLKRNALAAPFEQAFTSQQAGKQSDLMVVHYREHEAIYIRAQPDRVTVIFSTMFQEETDRIFGKVFLQEFVDARKQSNIQSAPQVLYTYREPPMELRGAQGLLDSESMGYVTFVLFPRHFSTPDAREKCVSLVELFRDYLHYHIKASKAYMHSRMRARVDSFLKVLNRAKPEQPGKELKTASGKTFKRQ
jgi:actin related protein 2/3 complex subunit 2